jgi:hypothetical protein
VSYVQEARNGDKRREMVRNQRKPKSRKEEHVDKEHLNTQGNVRLQRLKVVKMMQTMQKGAGGGKRRNFRADICLF